MGLNLESWSSAAGGAVEGLQKGADYITKKNAEERLQQQERERLDQEALRQQTLEAYSQLPGLLKPQDMAAPIVPVPQQGALPAPGPTGTPPIVSPQGGTPPLAPPPPQGALPGGAPVSTSALPAEQAPPPSRRDQLADWHTRARALAMRAGGLDAVKDLDEYYFTNVKGQMFDYGKGAIDALSGEGMDSKSAVEAAKLLNTALELAPVDTGLTFRSVDGKLIGSRGGSEREYSKEEIAGLLEQQIVTPKNYMEFKKQWLEEDKQEEVERSARTKEGISQQNADATTLQAEVYAKESDTRELLRKAQAYNALASGKAALTRADGTGSEEGLAWSEENILKIEEMEGMIQEGKLGFTSSVWAGEEARNSQLMSDVIGAAKEIRIANPPNAMTHNDAAALSRMAYFDQLPEDKRQAPAGLAEVGVMTDDNGNFAVRYKGKVFIVPPEVATRINLNKQYAGD